MTTRPLWTRNAIVAYLADEPTCNTCHGSGRDDGGRRGSCRSCRGAGVPLTTRQALDAGMSRSEWKAHRQVTR
jgi:DnaJ-class molecular chaperone